MAEKLKNASIKNVDDLVDADIDEVSKKTGISEKRIKKWCERI